MAISATPRTAPLHLVGCSNPFQRNLIGRNGRHCINLCLQVNYLTLQRGLFGRTNGFSAYLWARKIFSKIGCRDSRIGRRFLLGGALWQGLAMAGEGSSFSAAAKAKRSEIEEVKDCMALCNMVGVSNRSMEDLILGNLVTELSLPTQPHPSPCLSVVDSFIDIGTSNGLLMDRSPDELFYSAPRFVTHIDDPAINALTKFYESVFPPKNTPGVALLDMCSSWVSHYPKGYKQDRIVGMGMNEEELKHNPVLTDYVVQDLNVNPKLPFEDNSFDVITNVVSVDYLNKPLDVFKEMRRVLKPQGLAIVSFSNRCFWTKAISIWTSTSDVDHVWIVGSYFHYAGGFEPPQALDISPSPGRTDPMYVVFSRKLVA